MKYLLFLSLLLLIILPVSAQNHQVDSLSAAYTKAKTDSGRADILFDLANLYAQDKPDSELFKARQALFISRKAKYLTGERRALKQMAEAYQFMGNYPLALQFYLERLKLDEHYKGSEEEVVTLLSVANLYLSEGDFQQALTYAKQGEALINRGRFKDYRWYNDMVFGEIYEKLGDPRQALLYDDRAYRLALAEGNKAWLGMALNNTGNAYLKAGDLQQALSHYRLGIPYLLIGQNASFLCESYQGIATIKFRTGQPDSALIYAKKSLALAIDRNFNENYIRACELLTEVYKKQHQPDSALSYLGKLVIMKDSVYSQEKEKQIVSLTLAEQLRQKDLLEEKAEQDRHRTYVLNMLLIGLLIPFSFLVSLVMSKRKMHPKVVAFSGVISLLLLFEYLTILLHPAVEHWTNDSPFLEIMIFVAVAAVLTPAHHRLEHWMLTKLTAHHHHPAAVPPLQPPTAETIPDPPEPLL
jgi:tetratricopeptide (TPR) repeat protein